MSQTTLQPSNQATRRRAAAVVGCVAALLASLVTTGSVNFTQPAVAVADSTRATIVLLPESQSSDQAVAESSADDGPANEVRGISISMPRVVRADAQVEQLPAASQATPSADTTSHVHVQLPQDREVETTTETAAPRQLAQAQPPAVAPVVEDPAPVQFQVVSVAAEVPAAAPAQIETTPAAPAAAPAQIETAPAAPAAAPAQIETTSAAPTPAPVRVAAPAVGRAGPSGVVNQIPASAYAWTDANGWSIEWRQGPGPGRIAEAQYSTSTIVIWYDTSRSDATWAGAFGHELGHAVSFRHFSTQQMNEWNQMRGLSSWRWVPGTSNDFSVGEGDFAEAFMSYLLGHSVRSVGGPLTQQQRAWISANTPF